MSAYTLNIGAYTHIVIEESFGARRAAALRGLLREVVSCELEKSLPGSVPQGR